MSKFIARKPIVKIETYKKFGLVITLHQFCFCPKCKNILNAGPNYQPKYCDQCGQKINFSNMEWEKEKQIGYVEGSTYEQVKD